MLVFEAVYGRHRAIETDVNVPPGRQIRRAEPGRTAASVVRTVDIVTRLPPQVMPVSYAAHIRNGLKAHLRQTMPQWKLGFVKLLQQQPGQGQVLQESVR